MHILIVRLSALGDIVHAIPAAAALRRAYPEARIDWLVDARYRELVDLVTVIDRRIVVARSSALGWLQVLRDLRADSYDVACDFQGLLKSAVLARGSGAARVAGFALGHLRERLARPFYTVTAPAEGGHAIQKNLRLLHTLGISDSQIEFPLAAIDSGALQTLRTAIGGSPFAVINPGAAWPNKRWPPDRLAAVARHLREHHGLASVVLWGPGEAEAASAVVAGAAGSAHLAPPTGLQELIALAQGARLMVSGDTGPLHMTSALGVPAVALFGPTNPLRNGPWDPEDISLSEYSRCDCHYERRCRRAAADWCLGRIGTGDVVQAIDTRLRRANAVAGSRQV